MEVKQFNRNFLNDLKEINGAIIYLFLKNINLKVSTLIKPFYFMIHRLQQF